MFLFTTPASGPGPAATLSSRPADASGAVVDAIRDGAARSGTSFDYLLATAKKESALDPSAKAPTSSATGLFQFIEQTWLGLVKSDGAQAGLGEFASAITTRPDGTLTVADPGTKQAILKLREDPQLASAFAGTLARKNKATLASETGREPSAGDLYAAHVLGARGAAELINTASTTPTRAAALDFPEAATANRGLFYDRAGRPRSTSEVYAALTASYAGQGTAVNGAEPTGAAAAAPAQSGPALYGLFQTGTRPGPVSDAVARIWRTNNAGRGSAAVASFFPREGTPPERAEAGRRDASPEPARVASAGELAGIAPADTSVAPPPLPPSRPRFPTDGGHPIAGRAFSSSPTRGRDR